ncbi:MAG: folylpolyglutamate synthase/dihydrofolate synthase family protein [Propionibacteriaceae bacterium]
MSANQTHAQIVAELTQRWPEHRVAPSLGRIRALTELLGDPQDAYPVIHLTGTNGKGSTAAMIEALLRALGLRTGRFTSPHVMTVNERITIDGLPISDERFDEVWTEIQPYVALVDEQLIDGVRLTFFEIITAMAYAAFSDAPVDVAVVEVGLGGTWDATNVVDAGVAVVTPIDLDHTHLLGNTIREIATEKAGIIKPGAHAILAGQSLEAATVLLERCAEVGALAHREGIDFGLIDRSVAVGGQLIRLNGAEGPVDDIFLPLHGAHQAANAAQALAAVEAFMGLKAVNPDVVRAGFADVVFPGRLEVVRRSPTVVLDAAHNPHGARATAAAVAEAFSFSPLIGVVAVMADKDADGLLREFEEVMNQVVITQVASTSRGMPAEELADLARGIFGHERVRLVPRLDDAIETAIGMAEVEGIGAPGVLVTGSVVAVGEARTLLVSKEKERETTNDTSDYPDDDWDADYSDDGSDDPFNTDEELR